MNKNNNEDIPVNDQDKRCAPHLSFQDGSCIRLEILVKMAEAFNNEFPNNAIVLDSKPEILHPNRYKKYLIKEFTERLGEKCGTQSCWARQDFIKKLPRMAQEELQKYTFRPEGPDESIEWLNTTHINEVMAQYEKKYPDFKFLGAVPRDFQNHEMYSVDNTDDAYEKLWKSEKSKIGIIYNTDKANSGGEHWNALFADFNNGLVYFFDSYGVAPNKEVRDHMKQIEKFIKDNCGKMTQINRNKNNLMKCSQVKSDHNKERHQYKGYNCGVYSMNFIIRMLKGDAFEDICRSKVHDDTIQKYRKVYFTREEA